MTTNNAPAAGEAADTQNAMTSNQVLGAEEGDPLDAIVREIERLKFERDDFEQQLKGKSAELETLTGISAKAADSLKQKDDQIAGLQQQLDDLNAQLAAKAPAEQEAEKMGLVGQAPQAVAAEGVQAELAPQVDFDAELKAKDETIAGLNDQLVQAKSDLEANLQTQAAAQGEAETRQKELDATKAANQALQQEVDALHKQLDQINKGVQAELRQDDGGGIPVLGTVAATSAVTAGIKKRSAEEELEDANKRIAELEQALAAAKPAAPEAPLTPEVPVAPEAPVVEALSVEAPSVEATVEAPAVTPVDASQEAASLVAPATLAAGVTAAVAVDGANRTAELEAQLAAKEAELADLQARIDALKNVLNARGLDLDSAEQQRLSLVQTHTATLDEAQNQLTVLSSDNDALSVSKAEVEAQLKAAHADIESLNLAKSETDNALAGKVSEIGVLTAGAAAAAIALKQKDTALVDLQTQLDALTTEKAGVEATLGESNAKLADLQTQFDALVEANSKMATLQTQVDELTAAKAAAETALADAQTKLADLTSNVDSLSLEKNSLVGNLDTHKLELEGINAKVTDLTAQLEAANSSRAGVEAQLADLNRQLAGERDDKERSVGAQIAKVAALTAALAAANVASGKREEEAQAVQKQVVDLQAQIGNLAAERDAVNAKLAALQDELNGAAAARDAAQARVADLEAGVSSGSASLEAAQSQLKDAQDQAMALAAERDTAQAQVKSLEDELASLRANGSAPAPAGVASLAALGTVAAVTTSQSKDAAVDAATAAGVETKTSACPQDLAEVTAIGSVFEQRLYGAGVGTYWELAQLTDEQFKTILQLNDRQLARMDFAAIRNDALRLAHETESVGRIWGGNAPDDFEPLEGIGGTYEKRLYDAGICTYEALANTPVEELMRLCPPTKLRKPDYELWLRQARALISQPKG